MQAICNAWLALENWFTMLDVPVRASMISAFATALSAAVAAWVVFAQIGRQARKARENNRYLEQTKLKLEIYNGILKVCRKAMDASLDATDHIRQFAAAIAIAQISKNDSIPAQRFASHQANMTKAIMKAIKIINAVEAWEVVDPRLKVFQIAMASAQHDIRAANHEYLGIAMFVFPAPKPDGELFPWFLPPPETKEKLDAVGNVLIDKLNTMDAYVDDFQREMQKLLVGPLFPENAVGFRAPLDPNFKVIRLDRHKEIITDFERNSAWGKSNEQTKQEVAALYAKTEMRSN